MRNYARFYGWKFLEYWFEKDPFKRRYLLGCLTAFVTTTLNKRFYNLKRVKQKGLHTEVDFGFDQSRILSKEDIAKRKQQRPDLAADVNFEGTISACGAPNDLPYNETQAQETATTTNQRENAVIQVFLLEDEEQIRVSLRKSLRAQEDIDIYSEATNAETGLVLLTSVAGADVALIDYSLPDQDGASLTREFRRIQSDSDNPNLKVCIMLDQPDETTILQAFAAGAESYCLKNITVGELSEVIALTHDGKHYLHPRLAQIILPAVKNQENLTQTQKNILELMADGFNHEAIADQLEINLQDVNQQIQELTKLFVVRALAL